MTAALTYVGVCLGVLIILTFVYVVEDIKGERVFLKGSRAWLDQIFEWILKRLAGVRTFFTHGFMRLLLHYSAHKVLKRLLTTLQRLEKKVEELVRRNRKVAKTIKDAKENHLHAIAAHKEEVSLSEEQKEELRSH
jgi:hypothetical protein